MSGLTYRRMHERTPVRATACQVVLLLYFIASIARADTSQLAVLTGSVLDGEGKAVQGAEIFLYSGSDVRRPADFISPRTDADGKFAVTVPQGMYRAVARLRNGGERYGPLLPGDRHSGDPVEIEILSAVQEASFTVMNLQEAALATPKKTNERFVRIRGRIVDSNGRPIKESYVVANKSPEIVEMPHYLSASTNEDGRYTLFIPAGVYFMGAAASFPPRSGWVPRIKMAVAENTENLDIVMHNELD